MGSGKFCKVVWDSHEDYGIIEWQWTLKDLAKVPVVAYQDVIDECDLLLCNDFMCYCQ